MFADAGHYVEQDFADFLVRELGLPVERGHVDHAGRFHFARRFEDALQVIDGRLAFFLHVGDEIAVVRSPSTSR